MTSQSLIYREADSTEVADIIILIRIAYQDYSSALTAQDWHRMEVNLSNESQFLDLMNRATTFVCELNNQVIGVAFLIPKGNPTRIFPADWCYIRLLGVDPKYRGLGIGRKLTELCITQARSNGEITIALHTSEFMNTARTLYEQLGFRQVKELAPIYNKRYWLYKLSLSGT